VTRITHLDTYIVNRDLSFIGQSAKSRRDPVTHTFVVVTNSDGSINHTYSWGTDVDLMGWATDYPLDRATAEQALREGLAERAGGSEFDPFVEEAFNELNIPQNRHFNLFLAENCKKETRRLIKRADKKMQDWMNSTKPVIDYPYAGNITF